MKINDKELYNELAEIHKAIIHANYEDALPKTIKLMEQCFDNKEVAR